MNTCWDRALDELGASYAGDAVVHFGDAVAETGRTLDGDVRTPLIHRGSLRVTGADAAALLQGQLTNDIRKVDAGHGQLSAWCSPKGRVLTVFRILPLDGSGFELVMPRAQVGEILNRLRMYVLRADVGLDDASATHTSIGLAGPRAPGRIAEWVGEAPALADAIAARDGMTAVRLPGERPRFEIRGPSERILERWSEASTEFEAVGADAWEALDIRAGVPDLAPELSDAFLPQMLNLEILDAVSFDKGCYVGQEIVARTQYLGRLKRRLYRAHASPGTDPERGDALYTGGDAGGQSVGTVVNRSPDPAGGWDLLAVIRIDLAEIGPIRLRHVLGPELDLRPLPYSMAPAAA